MQTPRLSPLNLIGALGLACGLAAAACKTSEVVLATDEPDAGEVAPPDAAVAPPSADLAAPSDLAMPPRCTDKMSTLTGTVTKMMMSRGQNRTYLFHIPARYDPTKPTALVVAFHGLSDNAQNFFKYIDLANQADAYNLIALTPLGLGFIPSWNAGGCCFEAQLFKIDDVGFTRDMIDATRRNPTALGPRSVGGQDGTPNRYGGGADDVLLWCRALVADRDFERDRDGRRHPGSDPHGLRSLCQHSLLWRLPLTDASRVRRRGRKCGPRRGTGGAAVHTGRCHALAAACADYHDRRTRRAAAIGREPLRAFRRHQVRDHGAERDRCHQSLGFGLY